jgi:hypothetical protein
MSTRPDPYTDPGETPSGADTSGAASPGPASGPAWPVAGVGPEPDVGRSTSPGAGSTEPVSGPAVPGTPGYRTTRPDVDVSPHLPGTGRVPAAGRHGEPEGLSLGELFAEVSRDLSALVRQEIALARAETMESAKRAGRGGGMLAGAAVGAVMVLLFLSLALWWALGTVIGLGWSALIVAVVWAIVAAVLFAVGRREVKETPGLPETADSIKQIPQALQGNEEMNR